MEYVKYSNDRAPEYAIKTEIGRNSRGERRVRKYPMTSEAAEHIRGMAAAHDSLAEKYRGGKLEINRCSLSEDEEQIYIEFEFVRGEALSELMDRCLDRDDREGFHRLFSEYMERVGYGSEYPAADYDLIFSNILVDGDKWTLIDYEWTFGKQIDTKEIAFRAIYCYLLEDEKRNKLNLDSILESLGITEAEAESFREQERDFQGFVTGKHMSLAQLRELIGYRVAVPQDRLEEYWESEKKKRIQIYEDRGKGCSEEESYLVRPIYGNDGKVELELQVAGDVQVLRIDPAFGSCIVRIEELTFNNEPVPLKRKHVLLNGKRIKPSTLVFPTEDPNINILLDRLPRNLENKLFVRMEVALLPLSIVQEMTSGKRHSFRA